MNRDKSLSLSQNVGLGSLGAFLTRALTRSQDRLDWEDRQRFEILLHLVQSAWRGAQPLSQLREVRQQARMAARASAEPQELPTVDQDARNSQLFLNLGLGLENKTDVSHFVKGIEPSIEQLATSGALEELRRSSNPHIDELQKLVRALAHINDDVLDRRHELTTA